MPASAAKKKSIRFRARSFVAFALSPEAPLDGWLDRLDGWTANSPGYFAGRPILLDLNGLSLSPDEIRTLVAALSTRGIRVYAIEAKDIAQLDADLPPLLVGAKAGPAEKAAAPQQTEQPETTAAEAEPAQDEPAAAQAEPAAAQAEPVAEEVVAASAEPAVEAEPAAAPQEAAPAKPETHNSTSMIIRTPVRSGQSIYQPNGDVIVLASVASGSEIVATGSVHVYGTLRGRVIAGASGDREARIFCQKNEAELLAVDGWYRTAESMEPASRGRPIQAYLENGVVQVAALN